MTSFFIGFEPSGPSVIPIFESSSSKPNSERSISSLSDKLCDSVPPLGTDSGIPCAATAASNELNISSSASPCAFGEFPLCVEVAFIAAAFSGVSSTAIDSASSSKSTLMSSVCSSLISAGSLEGALEEKSPPMKSPKSISPSSNEISCEPPESPMKASKSISPSSNEISVSSDLVSPPVFCSG